MIPGKASLIKKDGGPSLRQSGVRVLLIYRSCRPELRLVSIVPTLRRMEERTILREEK